MGKPPFGRLFGLPGYTYHFKCSLPSKTVVSEGVCFDPQAWWCLLQWDGVTVAASQHITHDKVIAVGFKQKKGKETETCRRENAGTLGMVP